MKKRGTKDLTVPSERQYQTEARAGGGSERSAVGVSVGWGTTCSRRDD